MTENTTATESALTLGAQLRQAREALNLTMDDVAAKINLRPSILTKLENNQFVDPNTPPAFMRGYIRSYLKFLRLPENLISDSGLNFGETQKNDLGKNARAKKAVNSYSSHNRWVSWLTWLIILVAIAMTVLWWWENYQQSNAERDNLVENYVATNVIEVKSVENANSTEMTPALTVVENNNSTNTEIQPTVSGAAIPEQTAVQAEPITVSSVEATTQPVETPVIPATKTENNETENSETNTTNAAESADLRIEVTGSSCWISVKDANSKVLAQKEYRQGEILTFNEGSPYSLIIGAPGNVKITYQGNDFPLKVDGKVKKFKLPQ
ncbi:cytoskeleton protein RodZ [Cricetibacter osteomyelitidis]|uniref:Cytoskeleton protein RodZ n=1 Tax=Cricetibacter osteomyelitidis TaxID=1521931 RepID=A0A4R2T898_9PAST|nr:RodZ family helix-turn-helix domain-containing protein [Cricetibacter osteomyelitidis]TCP93408.1 cytoskeleton protein RodZ [Cricetibacter osteomyelitidis]